jgi:NLR family CARD domain-containing protein 3
MPAQIAETNLFNPIFDYLTNNDPMPLNGNDISFIRGTLFNDGRIDMCKQMVGPPSINDLCESVMYNTQFKHFLLGNNMACLSQEDNNINGALSLKRLMETNNLIETYYLAGNCITSDCLKIICEGLKSNTSCKSLWLKRNPLGIRGGKIIGELLNINHSIEILDLENCGLLDEGLINFCESITCSPKDFSVKYLYLNANGITSKSIPIFSKFLSKYMIKSLFLSLNNISNVGLHDLCSNLKQQQILENLSIASCGISDISPLINCINLNICPKLTILDIGTDKNTLDLQEQPNIIEDTSLIQLIKLVKKCESLKLLKIRYCRMSDYAKFILLHLCNISNIITTMYIDNYNHLNYNLINYRNNHDIKLCFREISHSDKVKHIDSIYRGKM